MERRSFFASLFAGLVALFSPKAWTQRKRVSAQRVQFPRFEVFNNPQISIRDIRQRRFDIIDRY